MRDASGLGRGARSRALGAKGAEIDQRREPRAALPNDVNNRRTGTDAAALDRRRIYYDLVGPRPDRSSASTHSLASDGGMWAEQVPPLLAAGYRVLRLDMRGHGGSDPVAGDYTMAQLADDVAAVAGFPRHRRACTSWASRSAACWVRPSPSSMATSSSPHVCDTLPANAARRAGGLGAAHRGGEERPTPLRRSPTRTMERWFTDAFKPRNPGRWKQIHDTIVGTTPAGYLGCAAAILNFDFMPRLPSLKVPTLVVCGAEDEGTPPAGNKKIAELVPGGRYEEIADARHFPNVEHPDTFNRIMLAWLAKRIADAARPLEIVDTRPRVGHPCRGAGGRQLLADWLAGAQRTLVDLTTSCSRLALDGDLAHLGRTDERARGLRVQFEAVAAVSFKV